jgi:CRISPR/Cas system-associated endonuclease/helicase Cas3
VKSNTLLLSGTPIELNYLWDTLLNQTKVLPDSKSHLKAIHTEKYAINVLNEPPEKLGLNSLYFTNTIKNCQNIGELYKNSILVHSDFTKEHREERMSNLMSSYGKNPISNVKLPYISTLILQAALDISFSKVYDVPLSPESTLQRLGRCNRWGEINNAELNIVINDENNTGNALITELLYSKELNGKWLEVLRGLDKCKLTLDEIYKLYNDFNNNNANEIKRFVKNELNASSKAISNNIYPIKRKIISGNNGRKVFKGGGNPLRSSGNEVFYIVKDNKGCWVGPFNKKIEKRWDKEFKEKG